MELPLGITEAKVLAIANSDMVNFSGDFEQDMDLGYDFDLPSRSMTFSTSTDPAAGIYFKGEMDIPHLSYNLVEGEYNTSNFSFTGKVNTEIDFNGLKIPIVNGNLTINSSGISLGGGYSLPFGLQTAQMNGSVTENELAVAGRLGSAIKIGGYSFKMSNSYINASTLTGVKLGGYINLKVFTAKVDGSLTASGYRMTGKTTYSSKLLVANINVVATQSAVSLSGTGTVYGLLGNKLASGNITFKPNWAAGTMQACIKGYCVDL